MKIIYNGPGKTNSVKDLKYNYNNFIAIEIRGNSSQSYPQKQYVLNCAIASQVMIWTPHSRHAQRRDWVYMRLIMILVYCAM
jgi:hypothetical protein